MYISGSLGGVARLIPVLTRLWSPRGGPNTILGSSGGVLLAAFLSLSPTSVNEERAFIALVDTLRLSRIWTETIDATRAWVRSLSGGASCTMRQWAARFAGFSALVYDYSSARPVLVTSESRVSVAALLAHAVLRDTPTQNLPLAVRQTWIDVEAVAPSSFLVRAIAPPPGLHFSSRPCAEEQQAAGSCLIPGAPYVDLAYERMLRLPPVHLTWTVIVPHASSLAAAVFNPSRWSEFLRSKKWAHPSNAVDGECALVPFALALVTWVLVLDGLGRSWSPEQLFGRSHFAAPALGCALKESDAHRCDGVRRQATFLASPKIGVRRAPMDASQRSEPPRFLPCASR